MTTIAELGAGTTINLLKVETTHYRRNATVQHLLEWAGLTENDAATMTVDELIQLCYDCEDADLGFTYWIESHGDVQGSVTTWEVDLQCDMRAYCQNKVTHIGDRGWIYCAEHARARRGQELTRKLTKAELATLNAGEPVKSFTIGEPS